MIVHKTRSKKLSRKRTPACWRRLSHLQLEEHVRAFVYFIKRDQSCSILMFSFVVPRDLVFASRLTIVHFHGFSVSRISICDQTRCLLDGSHSTSLQNNCCLDRMCSFTPFTPNPCYATSLDSWWPVARCGSLSTFHCFTTPHHRAMPPNHNAIPRFSRGACFQPWRNI